MGFEVFWRCHEERIGISVGVDSAPVPPQPLYDILHGVFGVGTLSEECVGEAVHPVFEPGQQYVEIVIFHLSYDIYTNKGLEMQHCR